MAGSNGFTQVSDNEKKSMNFVDDMYVTELWGELYFKESSKSSWPSLLPQRSSNSQAEVEAMKSGGKNADTSKNANITKTSRTNSKSFPPPLTSIDPTTGKPLISLKSYRHNGRLIIKVVKGQESSHPARGDEDEGEKAAEVSEDLEAKDNGMDGNM